MEGVHRGMKMDEDIGWRLSRLASAVEAHDGALRASLHLAIAMRELLVDFKRERSRPLTAAEVERALDWWVTFCLASSLGVAMAVGYS